MHLNSCVCVCQFLRVDGKVYVMCEGERGKHCNTLDWLGYTTGHCGGERHRTSSTVKDNSNTTFNIRTITLAATTFSNFVGGHIDGDRGILLRRSLQQNRIVGQDLVNVVVHLQCEERVVLTTTITVDMCSTREDNNNNNLP